MASYQYCQYQAADSSVSTFQPHAHTHTECTQQYILEFYKEQSFSILIQNA